jgi:hypothetical protein
MVLNQTIIGEKKARVDFPFFLFLLIGLPIEIALTLLSQRVYTHYFILWVPYLAWMIGYAILLIPPVIHEQINRILLYPAGWMALTARCEQPDIKPFPVNSID